MSVLALLSIAVLNPQLKLDPIVGTAPTVIEKLAAASGMKLKYNKNVANDVIALAAPNSTAKEIMDQMAYTLQAEWTEAGGEWTLARTDEQLKEQAAAHHKVTVEHLRKAMEKFPKVEPWKDESDARALALQIENFERQTENQNFVSQNYRALQNKMPDSRLLHQILASFPLETLADTPVQGRVVYSSSPNRLQKPLPKSADAPIAQFIRENKLLIEAYERAGMGENARYFGKPPSVSKVAKVIVWTKRVTLGGLETHLTLLDDKGAEVGTASHNFELDLRSDLMNPPTRVTGDDVLVELKPLSKELVESARTMMEGQNGRVSKAVVDYLRTPKKNELLGMINLEAVEAMAKAANKPVAVALPELQIFVILALSADGKVSLKRYESSLISSGLERTEKNGWICFREIDPHLGRLRRVDRTAYEEYCQRIAREQRNSLDGFAEFVWKYPGRVENTLLPIFMMISGTYPTNFQYEDDLNMVRFYATLTPAQKKVLAEGKPHGISDFTAQQQTILSNYIYGQQLRNYSVSYEDAPELTTESRRQMTTESTEVFPNGLQAPFSVTAAVTDSPSWFVKQSYGEARPTEAQSIAWERYTHERPDLFPYVTQFANDQGTYAQGQARAWKFTLQIRKGVQTEVDLVDHTFPALDKFIKFEQLPADFKAEIEKSIKQHREQHKNAKPGDFGLGRGSPPPVRK